MSHESEAPLFLDDRLVGGRAVGQGDPEGIDASGQLCHLKRRQRFGASLLLDDLPQLIHKTEVDGTRDVAKIETQPISHWVGVHDDFGLILIHVDGYNLGIVGIALAIDREKAVIIGARKRGAINDLIGTGLGGRAGPRN